MSASLTGRVALVTGVSRRDGIAWTLAERLQALGATVVASGWPPHDDEMAWGADTSAPGTAAFAGELDVRDLEDPSAPAALVDAVVARHGTLDIVVATHARSSHGGLADMTAEELDRCWAANVRSIVLLAQRFAAVSREFDPERPRGRMLWFTSGQHRGPMADELGYAVTKGALHQMTASVAAALIDHGIVANCINPGPVDTGWATGATHAEIARRFPGGRWGTAEDVANLVAFLVSDEGAWIQGTVIDSEGGFRRDG